VIAGGSDGVGESFAHEIARRGVNVVLVARRAPVLDSLAAKVRATHGVEVRTVTLDLSLDIAIERLASETADIEVGLLVYNAGADDHSSLFLDVAIEDHLAMVQRNCASVIGAAHRFGSAMVTRGRGGVVLVSSGAAWVGARSIATYGATKAFDLILAEALWAEWHERGVDVLGLVLGSTDTPALRRLLERTGGDFGELANPDDVATEALDHLADGPTWSFGMPDPAAGSPFGALARRDAVLLMSQAAAAMFADSSGENGSG
jgi:short-subunit dehydrogenase